MLLGRLRFTAYRPRRADAEATERPCCQLPPPLPHIRTASVFGVSERSTFSGGIHLCSTYQHFGGQTERRRFGSREHAPPPRIAGFSGNLPAMVKSIVQRQRAQRVLRLRVFVCVPLTLYK